MINHFKKIIFELYEFIKDPKDERAKSITFKSKLSYILSFLIIELFITVVLILPLLQFIHSVESIISSSRIDYRGETIGGQILLGVVIAPLLEELIFRGILRYKWYSDVFVIKERWDNKYFKYLVYISIISFALLHSTNYENSSVIFYLLLPMLVLSQAFGGLILTFLRVRFSLWTSICYHSSWNLIVILLSFFYLSEPYIKDNKDYNVKIEQLVFFDKDDQKSEIIIKNDKVYKLKFHDYSINHILDTICNYKSTNEDFLINFDLKSEKGITKNRVKEILLEYYEKE